MAPPISPGLIHSISFCNEPKGVCYLYAQSTLHRVMYRRLRLIFCLPCRGCYQRYHCCWGKIPIDRILISFFWEGVYSKKQQANKKCNHPLFGNLKWSIYPSFYIISTDSRRSIVGFLIYLLVVFPMVAAGTIKFLTDAPKQNFELNNGCNGKVREHCYFMAVSNSSLVRLN